MSSKASVIRPYAVAPAMVVSNSAVETHAEYNAATSYALNDHCTMAATGRLYLCIQGPSLAHAPDVSPLYWADAGPSNRWAMFDSQISTQTTASATLSTTLATGLIDSVAVVGVDAQMVRCQVRDGLGGTIVYDQTQLFTGDIPTDWYAYFFFDENSARSLGLFQDIPPYQTSHLTITLTSGGDVALGSLIFGLSSDIGRTEMGATTGIIDFSRKSTSTTGVTTFEQRAYSKRMSISLLLNRAESNRVQRLLAGLRATPAIWIATDDTSLEESMVIYGFYRDFSSTIAYFESTFYSLEIEGLV
jgi:hypothetical protein